MPVCSHLQKYRQDEASSSEDQQQQQPQQPLQQQQRHQRHQRQQRPPLLQGHAGAGGPRGRRPGHSSAAAGWLGTSGHSLTRGWCKSGAAGARLRRSMRTRTSRRPTHGCCFRASRRRWASRRWHQGPLAFWGNSRWQACRISWRPCMAPRSSCTSPQRRRWRPAQQPRPTGLTTSPGRGQGLGVARRLGAHTHSLPRGCWARQQGLRREALQPHLQPEPAGWGCSAATPCRCRRQLQLQPGP